MKTLLFFMLLPSLFTPPSNNSKTLCQSFSIHHFATSLVIEVNGNVEIEYWDEDLIQVNTIIHSPSNESIYALKYAIQKGNFDLVFSEQKPTIFSLKSKKNNSTIFYRGQRQKTKQTFKIFIPKQLQFTIK